MYIKVDKSSKLPVYRQIMDSIQELIDSGLLVSGERLPSSRELARSLGVTRKTVITAYQELSAIQYLDSTLGSGTYVSKLKGKRKKVAQSLDQYPEPKYEYGETPEQLHNMNWVQYVFNGEFFAMPRRNASDYKGIERFISFAKALPDPTQFPFDKIKKIASRLLWDPKAYFFDYSHPQGYQPLVEWISQCLASEQIDMREGHNDVVIASGFQVSLNLLFTLLLNKRQKVAVEDPTYTSILNLLIARKIEHAGIPVETDGMNLKALRKELETGEIGLIVTVPTLHNPTGCIMSLEKRKELLRLAADFQVPIVEDVYLMHLGYDGSRLPSLKALDSGGYVFQIGSFSKVFLPGLRIGWITVPSDVALPLVKMKRATDQGDSFFLQTILYEFIIKGYFELHTRKVKRVYDSRRQLFLEEMHKNMPDGVSWLEPRGGFSVWVSLPDGYNSRALYEHALKDGIEIAPGNFFHVNKRDVNTFRLAFSLLGHSEIKEGVKRLAKSISSFLDSTL
jgi:2-aminoadipate transaminase